jgi:hypothetical protein
MYLLVTIEVDESKVAVAILPTCNRSAPRLEGKGERR